jgi:heavy metal translocating P-type ATPase
LYCCGGCAHVAAILQSVGAESELGRLRLDAARRNNLLSTDGSPLDVFDSAIRHPPSAICHPVLSPERREELRFRIEGLACPSCAWLAEALLAGVEGVALAEVDFISDTARIVFDLLKTSRQAIVRTLAAAGYCLVPLDGDGNAADATRGLSTEHVDLIRLALAAFVCCNLMMLAWVGYDSFLSGEGEGPARGVAWMQLLFALPVVTWSAMPLYRRALAALRHGRVVMESLVSLGIVVAVLLSVVALVSGEIHVYFETAAALVAISLGGRALERWLKRRALWSLTGLLRFGPAKARSADDGRFAPLEAFARGARVAVEAGEIVPLDVRIAGPVEQSRDSEIVVRESLLTGEPRLVVRRPGELVLAGSALERGRLIGVVERPAGRTVADGIRERVAEALRRSDAQSRLADRLAQGFVPLVLAVAGAAFAGHWWHGDGAGAAMLSAVSVLVAACPCAFGMAASLALSLASLRLAAAGVLVREPAILETLRSPNVVVFDKTGTLTRGEMSLLAIGWTGTDDHGLLNAVRALEEHSRHPIGLSLTRLIPGAVEAAAEGIIEMQGLGVTGTVGGRRLAVGSPKMFASPKRPAPPAPAGATRVWFGCVGDEPAGYMDLADALRPGAPEFVAACKAKGIEVAVFSGDADETTRAIAQAAGISAAFGNLRPEAKAEKVRALRAEGRRVVYIGDGFNDAEALAAADVGVALAAGADLAMLSAPVVATRESLDGVGQLFEVARKTAKVVRANFVWAFIYNIALLPVAALGLLAPIHAAALMALSSASVALNSMRVGRVGNPSPVESGEAMERRRPSLCISLEDAGTFTGANFAEKVLDQ